MDSIRGQGASYFDAVHVETLAPGWTVDDSARYPHRMRTVLASSILCVLAFSCSEYPTKLASGEACQRSIECGDGLACVENLCTGDIEGIGGMVPNQDAGADATVPMDAAVPMDAVVVMDTSMPMDAAVEPDASMPDDAAVDTDATP
jgi:hypothetical protein